jgi:hypothetical protein
MAPRHSRVMALASSFWKLVSAWWNVDRIRIPESRQKDSDVAAVDQQFHDVKVARHRRASSKAKATIR